MSETTPQGQVWPFKPGEVVRSNGPTTVVEWLGAAPAGTVVGDPRGIEWTAGTAPDVDVLVWRSGHAIGFCTALGLSDLGPLTVVSVPALADGGPVPDCCDHRSGRVGAGCMDCLNTGHAHDPADPCPPEPQTTPQDAREGGRNSLEEVPGGERTSQGADGASVRSIGDRLRSAADYQDRPGAYDELRAMADEADRLERERHDADGHYHRVVGEVSALKGRLDATRGDLAAQEGIAQEMKASLDRLHTWAGLLELLDAHWPEDIFPTLTDDAVRDTGPRLVSALRRADRAEAVVERVRALASRWDKTEAEHRTGADSAWPTFNAERDLIANTIGQLTADIRAALDGGTEADRG